MKTFGGKLLAFLDEGSDWEKDGLEGERCLAKKRSQPLATFFGFFGKFVSYNKNHPHQNLIQGGFGVVDCQRSFAIVICESTIFYKINIET